LPPIGLAACRALSTQNSGERKPHNLAERAIVLTRASHQQRKTPGSFLPGVLLELDQTIRITRNKGTALKHLTPRLFRMALNK
jgi:hypothetical protein